ncbi:MAG: [Fe-S]-binding protein, partial [Sphingobacteriales bacterium]
MSQKKYWGNFGQFNQSDASKEAAANEFGEDLLPVEELNEGLLDGKTPRRDFLKYLGFSTAAAALAASCQTPVRKAIPYLQKPDNVTPGIADYYASTFVNGGDAISVVVKQREGRPIKIEGNKLSSITKGGTNARAQASVLDLYNTSRLRHPLQRSGSDYKEVSTFDAFDNMVMQAMANAGGKQVVLLTSTINSPSTLQVISRFLAKYPGSKHVQYDAFSNSGMLLANQADYGKRHIPSYHFDKAKTIVSLGADFLGTWISPVEFSVQYAAGRKMAAKNPQLSRHIHFESFMSLTGSNADDRFMHKPSETGAIALGILAKLGGSVSAPNISDANTKKGIDLAAAALNASKGQALVVCGSNDPAIQSVVNAINEAIGANGTTINHSVSSNYRMGVDADMVTLANDIQAGNVGALLVYDCNPVYSYADGKKLGENMLKLPVTVSFNSTMDETTECCKYVCPSHHWLESWGDAEPKTGYFSMMQPVINPLFKTRAFQTSLLKWSGASSAPVAITDSMAPRPALNITESDYESFFKNFWMAKLGGETNYNKALQDGVVEPAGAQSASATGASSDTTSISDSLSVGMPVIASSFSRGSYNSAGLADAANKAGSGKAGNIEVVFYEKVGVGNGSQANNPWLQELPDPITKVTWDNYAMVSPALAKTLTGIDVMGNKKHADDYEVHPEKPVVKLTINNRSVELPVMIVPGVHPSTIAVAVGYGRESANKEHTIERIGRSASGAGKNVYPLIGFGGASFLHNAVAAAEKVGGKYALAQTQVHGFTEGRPIIYETSLAAYKKNPKELLSHIREEKLALTAFGSKDYVKDATMYPDHEKPGIKWGMSIDMNTCTGCSACVIACNAENNV